MKIPRSVGDKSQVLLNAIRYVHSFKEILNFNSRLMKNKDIFVFTHVHKPALKGFIDSKIRACILEINTAKPLPYCNRKKNGEAPKD